MSFKNDIKLKSLPVVKRLANHSDLDALVNITKINFIDRALYQFKSLSKKYWKIALETTSAEIWVWEIDGAIAALTLIITDLETWNLIKLKWTSYNPIIRYFSYILLPRAFLKKIKKQLWIIKDKNVPKKMDNYQIPNESNYPPSSYRYGGVYCNLKTTLWNELAAVSPQFRRYGLAFQIAKFNEERAKVLGRHKIYGEIDADNEIWWMLHERLGWEKIYSRFGRFTYCKTLE